jgi:hypothetical protein
MVQHVATYVYAKCALHSIYAAGRHLFVVMHCMQKLLADALFKFQCKYSELSFAMHLKLMLSLFYQN